MNKIENVLINSGLILIIDEIIEKNEIDKSTKILLNITVEYLKNENERLTAEYFD